MALHLPGCCIHSPRRDLTKSGLCRVRKTWRSPIEKATGPADPEYEWLHEIADASAIEVQRKFLQAIRNFRGTVKEKELRAAIESGSVERVLAVLGADQTLEAHIEPMLMRSLQDVMQESARAALDATPAIAERGGELAMRFDMVNPQTVQAVRSYGFNLIRQISDDTRNGIRQIVGDAMEFGGHPYEQARRIRSLIGLTDNQAAAVSNFRRLLENKDREALRRALRDKRFDGTLDQALGFDAEKELSPEQVDRMVGRYAERMLNARAETIARTETISAARLGTQESWSQATESGLLDRATLRQGWFVVPDDRTCVYCAEVPLMNPEGVPLGQQFKTPLGPVDGPTLHPNCRCVLYLMGF